MKFDIESAIKSITKPWTPIDLAKFDDKILRIALFKGEYNEHSHDYDEFFFVYRGAIEIWTDDKTIKLKEGEGVTIPKKTKHKPISKVHSYVLMIDSGS